MANAEHLSKLREGVQAWNQWRVDSPGTIPNLREADLRRANLKAADLNWANLSVANFSEADLSGANLNWAQLIQADLREARNRSLRRSAQTKNPGLGNRTFSGHLDARRYEPSR
jgi:hypothetical protein